MPNVIRIFVEKRRGFDVEAAGMLSDLRVNLGFSSLKSVRLLNRYDVEGLSPEEFKLACDTVFSEPNVDDVYYETFSPGEGWRMFTMEYLPGQYDQRADSAAQCVQLLTQGERPKVASARVICLHGNINSEALKKIKAYLVNPVESRIASPDKPETLDMPVKQPKDVHRVTGFISMTAEQLEEYWNSVGFAMSQEDLAFCQSYFRDEEKRDPSVTELKVIDTYWSDHCRHTTFLTKLDNIEVERGALSSVIEASLSAYYEARQEVYGDRINKKNVTLMDMATMGMRLLKKRGLIPDLDESDEINACSIEVPVEIDGQTQSWLVQFKNETHNHPTEIEPFGGAATCLGGAIRDPLSGRAYVYQAMRVTGSGDPRVSFADTLSGKLPTRKITTGAAAGYSSYGNQIGLATGQVSELYDPGYVAKRMEIGAVIGASPKENVIREVPAPGDVVVLLGGRTGRDGCGGATGSSKAHTTDSIDTCGAEVQKGNPPTERKIQRLFRDPVVSRMIRRCNDFGAGGVCVAIGELADGLDIELDRVLKKYEGLDGTELAISESQERMAVVLNPDDTDVFIKAAQKENLEATPVAIVTREARLRMEWRGDTIVDISRDFLNTNGVTQTANAKIIPPNPDTDYRTTVPANLSLLSLADAFYENLGRLEVASQKGLAERFDSSIGAATVNMPFAGKYQLTPEDGMTAKLPVVSGETDTATAMTYGFIPGISRWSPFHGAAFAVTLSLAKLAAMGADPSHARLTFQEYFERLRDVPERWGKPAAALLGAFIAQREFGVPSIGGKDSMSGSFNELDVPPTLVSFAVDMVKASQVGTAAFHEHGSLVAFLPLPVDKQSRLPDFKNAMKLFKAVSSLVQSGAILSASVVREGGVAATIARMCFGNKIGFAFNGSIDRSTLFAPLAGSFIVELKEGDLCLADFEYKLLGSTMEDNSVILDNRELPLDSLIEKWMGTLEGIFPTVPAEKPSMLPSVPLYNKRNQAAPAIHTARPRVFIPVFPGTNCEYDTTRAFERAGGITDILVVKNLSASDIEETIEHMEQAIRSSQIVMLPGGFSGGDEPDGSGKFIATTFRNPRISDAIAELIEKRDGLILGICNGFQALIKLGLVPYGRIIELSEQDPTLTFNTLGRHVSRMVYTRVTSVKSPWLSGCDTGDIHCVPVSHGEGRFYANDSILHKLAANGQIATQYVSPDGKPSDDIEWNPNGSLCAVEGITSPDGRILGKMGHSERMGENLYKNVPGNKDQHIFESGILYFK
ncbi:MAG: phosphoribosylformylglycinamidine synthase [Oscillospiraceae bacterium]|nr:phosphoribosylformylglycinamidine synthase [Oscillospiraceae bacterium]